jgi:hypothetical protein
VHLTPNHLQASGDANQPRWSFQFKPSVLLYKATSARHSAGGTSLTWLQGSPKSAQADKSRSKPTNITKEIRMFTCLSQF